MIRYDNVLRGFDEVIGKGVVREMEREGVQFIKHARPKAVELDEKYLITILLKFQKEKKNKMKKKKQD